MGFSLDIFFVIFGGGIWSGLGVVNDSIFDFFLIGVGDYMFIYFLNNVLCNNELEVIVIVVGFEMVNVEDDVFCIDSESDMFFFNLGGGVW